MEAFAKQGGFYDIIREDKILKGYRHSRYFNLLWFKKNHFIANRILTFGDEVKNILDKDKYMIFRSSSGNIINFRFTNIKAGIVTNIKVHRDSHNVLNVRKKDAFFNPFVWVVANQLKYIEWPRKWKLIKEIFRNDENAISFVEHIENGQVKMRVYNLYHKHVLLDIDEIMAIAKEYTAIKRLHNLKPFSQKIFSKEALLALKKRK